MILLWRNAQHTYPRQQPQGSPGPCQCSFHPLVIAQSHSFHGWCPGGSPLHFSLSFHLEWSLAALSVHSLGCHNNLLTEHNSTLFAIFVCHWIFVDITPYNNQIHWLNIHESICWPPPFIFHIQDATNDLAPFPKYLALFVSFQQNIKQHCDFFFSYAYQFLVTSLVRSTAWYMHIYQIINHSFLLMYKNV